MQKIYVLCIFLLAFMHSSAHKSDDPVKGSFKEISSTRKIQAYSLQVIDNKNKTLAGVLVTSQQSGQTAFSAQNGRAVVVAIEGETLSLKMFGYQEKLVKLNKNRLPVFQLEEDSLTKRKFKNLINGRRSDTLRVASVDEVYTQDLKKSQTASIFNMLTGRLTGLYTSQGSGIPGGDGVSVQLRGQSPQVLIDGIPRSITQIDAEEIESITVLKDALATATLGVRSGQGAILITTRKGQADQQVISFTAQAGAQSPLKLPQTLSAFDYSRLYNEAIANEVLRGRITTPFTRFSSADLLAYQTGSDPIGHPDVDWQNELLRSSAPISRFNLTVSGGSKMVRYFIALENYNQAGLLKENDQNSYSTNSSIDRYIARSNVNIDFNDQTSLALRLFGRIMNGTQQGSGTNSIFSSILSTPNNAYPIFNADGSLGGNQQFTNNLYAQNFRSGYQASYNRDMIADIALTRKLDSWTQGLWIRGLASFNASTSQLTDRSKAFAVYQLQTPTTYQRFGADADQLNTSTVNALSRQVYTELSLGYTRRFNKQGIDFTFNASRDAITSNGNLDLIYSGFAGRLTYDYDKKYVIEAAAGLNSSNRYPIGTPLGFFPAIGASWNIYQEDFMQNFVIGDLKLSTSYGKTGWDQPGYYIYNQYYTDANTAGIGYVFGTAASVANGVTEATLANPNITWEKSNKFNVSLAGSLIKNRLNFNAEYFNTKYYDLIMQPAKASAIIGNSLPDENIGINRYTGFEFELNWNQRFGDFNFFANANGSLLKSKVLFSDEVFQRFDWMKRTGQPVGQPFGYIADGLYNTTDASSVAVEGYRPIPGDIRYKDLNADGVINQFDQTAIGSTKPLFFYGLNLGFDWKGLDFSALLQGVANRNVLPTGNGIYEFQNGGFGQAYERQLDRWTPATAATATYPSLSIGANPNNQVASSYWLKSGDYLRLKTIELGYTFSTGWIKKAKLKNIRVFANALNLFTISNLDGIDPEVPTGIYPMQRVINGGVNFKF